ncbi:hypothetical protein SpCBS45565_g05871 [Spizellomyces sp. 'palustris']|nr:hypothetical protein SpCBS45565_g05871 [Spizellomyces sp. 'palustris']
MLMFLEDELREDNGFVFKPSKSIKLETITPTESPKSPQTKKKTKASLPEPNPNVSRRKTTIAVPGGPLNLRVQTLRRSYAPSKLSEGDYTVNLPSSDTPIIERNKQMRNSGGRRRSSLGLRGKRVSAAHNGLCPPPHETIDPSDFYRHIDAELSDPNRMRQLLVWCAQRTLDGQSNEIKEDPADNLDRIFREIQEDVIAGLTSKKINTSWYHRPADSTPQPETPKKLPHPQNEANARQLEEYQRDLERLKAEEQQWISLLKDHTAAHADVLARLESKPEHDPVKPSLNDDECTILEEVCSGDFAKSIDGWMAEQYDSLQLELDNVDHVLRQTTAFEHRTRRFTDQVFEKVLKAYEEKDRKEKVADPMDILRLLSTAKPLGDI